MDFLSLVKRGRPDAPTRFGVDPRGDTNYIYGKYLKMQEIEQENKHILDSSSQSLIYTGAGDERLDKRLSTNLPYSRNFFEHIIKSNRIYVQTQHGKKIIPKKSYKLQSSDSIYIESLERFTDGGILEEAAYIPLEIKHETHDYIVIYKPKGVLSHPNSVRDLETPSVVTRAYHHYKNLPSTGNFIRAGLVHRLDRETDGYMILAKTEQGLAYFKDLFMQKSGAETIVGKDAVPLRKRYRAIVEVTKKGQQFLQSIASGLPYIHTQDVIPNTPNPSIKTGITKFLKTKPCTDETIYSIFGVGEYIYMDLEILTGRTHQIRYHLSSNGLPILGDYLYHPGYANSDSTTHPMQLSAIYLGFTDIYGEEIQMST